MRTVLFVCTGNVCRSPMAEAIARARAAPARHVRFESAGLAALDGAPATGHAVDAAAEVGADVSEHRARAATPQLVAGADEVYVMTTGHRAALERIVPGAVGRIHLLDPSERDVEDPYGGTLDDYRAACAQITAAIEARVPGWMA